MAIIYNGCEEPTEDGFYIVIEDNETTVAEYRDGDWSQIGIDYDCWTFGSRDITLEVVRRLDLDAMVKEMRGG